MVTAGGEVAFVQRMIKESLTTNKEVLWWTCMLGKLSSVVQIARELKELAKEGKVGGWGVSELPTGGGRTKRWVVIWSTTPLRLPDGLSRDGLPGSLETCRPGSAERLGKVVSKGPSYARKELLDVLEEMLSALEGCFVYPSAYRDLGKAEGGKDGWKMRDDMGTLDVIVTQESWTRRARRAKHRPQSSLQVAFKEDLPKQPLLMARISVTEVETGLAVKVAWIYGMDSVKFESFAMFLVSAVERKLAGLTDADAAKR